MITNYTKITNKTKNQTLISQCSSSIPYSSAIHITFSSSQSPKHNYMKFIQNVPPELQRTTKIQSFPWENSEQCNDLISHFYTSLHQVTYCRANPWDYAVALFHSYRTAAPSVRFCSPIGAFRTFLLPLASLSPPSSSKTEKPSTSGSTEYEFPFLPIILVLSSMLFLSLFSPKP